MDLIRSYLNKITDKNYIDNRNKIIDTIEQIIKDGASLEDMQKIGSNIFEIASNNRFYSKIYADLYSDLIGNYEAMASALQTGVDTFLETFSSIEYVEPSVDYDKFCKINKDNEKRRALCAFMINLMVNKIIDKPKIVQMLCNLLTQIHIFVNVENKKNEVDEITENVAILYKKELFTDEDFEKILIGDLEVLEFITKIANSKSKNYLSLSNKSIFKFMDMIEM